jgi:hypothetical protein
MQKENALEKFKTGWHKLVEQVFEVEKQLPFCSGVASIERENGMLKVQYVRADTLNEYQHFILSALEYRYERLSAKVCEVCGKYGIRRTELPITQTLCIRCYALAYSDEHPSVPSLVANPEPQID